MKSRSIFEKFLSPPDSNSDDVGKPREFFAEQLEARVLYSAAPMPMPDLVVHEAESEVANAKFESIDSFIESAQVDSRAVDLDPGSEVLVLTSFDGQQIEAPVKFDTNPVAFKQWNYEETGSPVVADDSQMIEFEMVSVDLVYFGSARAFEVNVHEPAENQVIYVDFEALSKSQDRLTVPNSEAIVHTTDFFSPASRVLGLSQIGEILTHRVEIVA